MPKPRVRSYDRQIVTGSRAVASRSAVTLPSTAQKGYALEVRKAHAAHHEPPAGKQWCPECWAPVSVVDGRFRRHDFGKSGRAHGGQMRLCAMSRKEAPQ